ncbi:MAG: hypothetical protein HKN42_16850 [Granulosicoccus sp.]|nr:hypothetical protein [Granulosicoccus sp.]
MDEQMSHGGASPNAVHQGAQSGHDSAPDASATERAQQELETMTEQSKDNHTEQQN